MEYPCLVNFENLSFTFVKAVAIEREDEKFNVALKLCELQCELIAHFGM